MYTIYGREEGELRMNVCVAFGDAVKAGFNSARISDTTDGRLLFLSGLKASLLFFRPDTSSFHSSDRDRQTQSS